MGLIKWTWFIRDAQSAHSFIFSTENRLFFVKTPKTSPSLKTLYRAETCELYYDLQRDDPLPAFGSGSRDRVAARAKDTPGKD